MLTLIANWSIGRAHDAAWVNAGVLCEIGGLQPPHRQFVDTLASSVGMAGRYL